MKTHIKLLKSKNRPTYKMKGRFFSVDLQKFFLIAANDAGAPRRN